MKKIMEDMFDVQSGKNIEKVFEVIISIMNTFEEHYDKETVLAYMKEQGYIIGGGFYVSKMLQSNIMKIAMNAYLKNTVSAKFIDIIDLVKDNKVNLEEVLIFNDELFRSIFGASKVKELKKMSYIDKNNEKLILLLEHNLDNALSSGSDYNKKCNNFLDSQIMQYVIHNSKL